jgi:hypothetical protein
MSAREATRRSAVVSLAPSVMFKAPATIWYSQSESQPDIRYQTSDMRHQISDIRHQTSDIRHQISDIRHQTSDIRHQTSDIRYQQKFLRGKHHITIMMMRGKKQNTLSEAAFTIAMTGRENTLREIAYTFPLMLMRGTDNERVWLETPLPAATLM